MEFLQSLSLEQIVLYVYFIFSIGVLLSILRKKRDEFWQAITGDDGKLQWREFIGFAWVFAFFYLLFGSSVFNLTVDPRLWTTLEVIFGSIVIRDIGIEAFSVKKKKQEEE